MCKLPYEIINEILKMACVLERNKWYIQIDFNGKNYYKYNIKNRFISKISECLIKYKNLYCNTIFISISENNNTNLNSSISNRGSLITIFFNDEFNYLYMILENNRYMFIKCYRKNSTEKGILYEENKETKIISFKIWLNWQINMTVYPRLAFCQIAI